MLLHTLIIYQIDLHTCWPNNCYTLELLTKVLLHTWTVDQIVDAHFNCLPKYCYTLLTHLNCLPNWCYTLELLTRLLLHTWIIDQNCCFTLELLTKLLLHTWTVDQIIITHLNNWQNAVTHSNCYQIVVTHLNCWPNCF